MSTLGIRRVREVGRYAVGIDWSDGHDSILPFRHLRHQCPCDECQGQRSAQDGPAIELARVRPIGERTLFLAWRDGHESLFLASELRGLCRCAHCVGEPDFPITGR